MHAAIYRCMQAASLQRLLLLPAMHGFDNGTLMGTDPVSVKGVCGCTWCSL